MMFNKANTVEQMILDACQGLGWQFVFGPQAARQAADVFASSSRNATTGNSLGRESEVTVPPRTPQSQRDDMCPAGAPMIYPCVFPGCRRMPSLRDFVRWDSLSPSDSRPRTLALGLSPSDSRPRTLALGLASEAITCHRFAVFDSDAPIPLCHGFEK